MSIALVLFTVFLVMIVFIAWRFRKANFKDSEALSGETVQLEVRPTRVESHLRGEERMFRPVLRLTQRRLFIGQLPLFGKNPVIRYAIHLDQGAEEPGGPLKTGYVSFRLRPEQFTWEENRLVLSPEGSGGLTGIPKKIVIEMEDISELRAGLQSVHGGFV